MDDVKVLLEIDDSSWQQVPIYFLRTYKGLRMRIIEKMCMLFEKLGVDWVESLLINLYIQSRPIFFSAYLRCV